MQLASTDDLEQRQRIWVVYAKEDALFATKIINEMEARGKNAWVYASEVDSEDWTAQSLRRHFASADYVVLLVSRNTVRPDWPNNESMLSVLTSLENRAITLIPVVVDGSGLPEFLAGYQAFDLENGSQSAIAALVDQMGRAPVLDFSKLDEERFERLIGELLGDLGFLIQPATGLHTMQPDFAAEFRYKDPFETEVVERWAIDVKFHRDQRVSPTTVRQLDIAVSGSQEVDRVALITNGQVTSVVRDIAASPGTRNRKPVRIIEGTELRRLLLRHPSLVEKYFGSAHGSSR